MFMQVFEGKLRSTFLNSIGRNSISSQKAYSSGLIHFDRFLNSLPDSGKKLDTETIIPMFQNQQINVYEILDNFVAYLTQLQNISIPSVKLYVAAVRSYLEYNEIDIVFSKFRRRVKMPKHYRDEEQPIDTQDIRKLLLKCNNRRLKAYILLLASSGVRTIEAASLRLQDIDFKEPPIKITVRKEFSKTRRARIVYCSDEATEYLQQLLDWKYRNKETAKSSDLIFSVYFVENAKPKDIYFRLIVEFEKLLISVGDGMDARKDNSRRHKITLHSFRRFCKGIVSDQAGSDYSEWFLGHNYSSYWTRKEQERRNIYAKKCMPYLTILDYTKLDTRSKNIEVALKEKDKAIQLLTKQMAEMQHSQEEMRVLLRNPKKLKEMIQQEG